MTEVTHIGSKRVSPFNSPFEFGFRVLFLLETMLPDAVDLQTLIAWDYLLVHSGDYPVGPPSLHPAVPFRSSELLVKREMLRQGLNKMNSRELLDKEFTAKGFLYRANDCTGLFLELLKTPYAEKLRERAIWVVNTFGDLPAEKLQSYMDAHVGVWGAEFEHLTALSELEL